MADRRAAPTSGGGGPESAATSRVSDATSVSDAGFYLPASGGNGARVLVEGVLKKRGANLPVMRERYCVASRDGGGGVLLRSYKNHKSFVRSPEKPAGEHALKCFGEWDGRGNFHRYDHAFLMETSDSKVFFCAASSADDKRRWISVMNSGVAPSPVGLVTLNSSRSSVGADGDAADERPSVARRQSSRAQNTLAPREHSLFEAESDEDSDGDGQATDSEQSPDDGLFRSSSGADSALLSGSDRGGASKAEPADWGIFGGDADDGPSVSKYDVVDRPVLLLDDELLTKPSGKSALASDAFLFEDVGPSRFGAVVVKNAAGASDDDLADFVDQGLAARLEREKSEKKLKQRVQKLESNRDLYAEMAAARLNSMRKEARHPTKKSPRELSFRPSQYVGDASEYNESEDGYSHMTESEADDLFAKSEVSSRRSAVEALVLGRASEHHETVHAELDDAAAVIEQDVKKKRRERRAVEDHQYQDVEREEEKAGDAAAETAQDPKKKRRERRAAENHQEEDAMREREEEKTEVASADIEQDVKKKRRERRAVEDHQYQDVEREEEMAEDAAAGTAQDAKKKRRERRAVENQVMKQENAEEAQQRETERRREERRARKEKKRQDDEDEAAAVAAAELARQHRDAMREREEEKARKHEKKERRERRERAALEKEKKHRKAKEAELQAEVERLRFAQLQQKADDEKKEKKKKRRDKEKYSPPTERIQRKEREVEAHADMSSALVLVETPAQVSAPAALASDLAAVSADPVSQPAAAVGVTPVATTQPPNSVPIGAPASQSATAPLPQQTTPMVNPLAAEVAAIPQAPLSQPTYVPPYFPGYPVPPQSLPLYAATPTFGGYQYPPQPFYPAQYASMGYGAMQSPYYPTPPPSFGYATPPMMSAAYPGAYPEMAGFGATPPSSGGVPAPEEEPAFIGPQLPSPKTRPPDAYPAPRFASIGPPPPPPNTSVASNNIAIGSSSSGVGATAAPRSTTPALPDLPDLPDIADF